LGHIPPPAGLIAKRRLSASQRFLVHDISTLFSLIYALPNSLPPIALHARESEKPFNLGLPSLLDYGLLEEM